MNQQQPPGGIDAGSLLPRIEFRAMFYRRIAISFIILTAVVTIGVVLAMSQPACYTSTTCGRNTFFGAMVVTVPITFLLAWLWGRWHERKTAFVLIRLEREYRQQVELVERERRRLSTVLNQMADGVLMTDDAGRILYLNPAAMRLLKTAEKDSLGQPFAAVAFHHLLIELWQKCRDERMEQTAALEIERRSYFVQAIVTPIRLVDHWNYLVILQDLTHIRRLETIRRDFISNVSHELLTPIAALRAVVETLQDGALEEPDVAARFLNNAQDEVDAITQIVSELLTLSRIESGQVSLRLKSIPAADLILPPIERLSPLAERQGIELLVDVGGGLPPVLADMEQIWQVITNIVHNALKYTPGGGQIAIRAVFEEADQAVIFQVADNGIGIPKADLPRIFERFYKADRARQRDRASGTGLGLSIAKHIVHAHDGEIWATSREGKGSTFYFKLPLADSREKIEPTAGG